MKATTSDGATLVEAALKAHAGAYFTIPGVVKFVQKPDRRFKRGYRKVPTQELIKFKME